MPPSLAPPRAAASATILPPPTARSMALREQLLAEQTSGFAAAYSGSDVDLLGQTRPSTRRREATRMLLG